MLVYHRILKNRHMLGFQKTTLLLVFWLLMVGQIKIFLRMQKIFIFIPCLLNFASLALKDTSPQLRSTFSFKQLIII